MQLKNPISEKWHSKKYLLQMFLIPEYYLKSLTTIKLPTTQIKVRLKCFSKKE